MGQLPTGTVTFLFTDLERSTRLWEEQPEGMKAALARHDELLADAVVAHGGHVIKTTGDGIHAVFSTADDAIVAAVAGQLALAGEEWGPVGAMRVRMGLHTGVAEQRDADYYGQVLNRAARLMEVAHASQVLCSQATADLARDSLAHPVELVDLGRQRLRDLERPEVVFQITHPQLPADFPPLRSLDAFPGNLPIERTTLIGRASELQRLSELLGDHRLITLTGVGGVGKTRLALQLAADVVERFPDGTWLAALASIRDPELVPSTVAAALGVAERPPRPSIDVLRDAVGSRELLIVLDNCEHLLDATARLVDALLDECPAVHIVATSREALGVEGEQSWPTPSLGLPETTDAENLDILGTADAVRLFLDRAQAVRPDFELRFDNAEAVADICRRLDGIPLAIELAAARVSALGPRDILERIDQRFLLLTGGSRTAMERHQTLRAAVDWSYELLDERERRLFDRLSVFVSGFTLEAACAVAGDDGTSEVEVLDLLGGLVAKSMVIVDGSGPSVRYRVLETLRQYGRERLVVDGDVEQVRDRHADYFLKFEESLVESYFGPDQIATQERKIIELPNLGAAFDWRVERDEPRLALRLARSTAGYGGSSDTLRRFDVALALAETLPPAERVTPVAEAAWAALLAGDFERATELAEESNTCARQSGVAPHVFAYIAVGLAAYWRGDGERAIAELNHAVDVGLAANDGSGRRLGQLSGAYMQSCFVLSQLGRTDAALHAGEEAVALARQMGGPFLLRQTLFHLGLACRTTDPERASALLEESLSLPQMSDESPNAVAWTRVAVGQLRSAQGDDTTALAEFAGTVEVCRQSGERFALPVALQGMARACRQLGRLEDATCLLAAADEFADTLGIAEGSEAVARQRAAARLRKLLGDERFDAEWNAGRSLSFDDAIARALHVAEQVKDGGNTPNG